MIEQFNPFSLEGKNFLITGASSGIGRVTSIILSKLGAGLILFPIFYLIQIVLFLIIVGNGWNTLIYFISLPISAVILYNWRRYWKSLIADAKLVKAKSYSEELRKRHNEIFGMISI